MRTAAVSWTLSRGEPELVAGRELGGGEVERVVR